MVMTLYIKKKKIATKKKERFSLDDIMIASNIRVNH